MTPYDIAVKKGLDKVARCLLESEFNLKEPREDSEEENEN